MSKYDVIVADPIRDRDYMLMDKYEIWEIVELVHDFGNTGYNVEANYKFDAKKVILTVYPQGVNVLLENMNIPYSK